MSSATSWTLYTCVCNAETRRHAHTSTHTGITGAASPQLPLLHLCVTQLDPSPAGLWAWITCKDLRKDFTKLIAKGEGGQITVAQLRKNLLGSWLDLCNRFCVCVNVCVYVPEIPLPPHPQPLPHAIYPFWTNWGIFFQTLLLHAFNYLFWREAIWWLVKRLWMCVHASVCVRETEWARGRELELDKVRVAFWVNVCEGRATVS